MLPTCHLCTAASTIRSGHATPPLSSLSRCRGSSCGGAKPLQMRRTLSADSRASVGRHGGLREAHMARTGTVGGGGLQGVGWLGTHKPKLKCMGRVSYTGLRESDLTGPRIDVAGQG